jgi:acetoin utilization protein AcuB
MSFIVSFNGQFKPYQVKEKQSLNRSAQAVSNLEGDKAIGETEENFKDTLNKQLEHPNKAHQKIQSYQKVKKVINEKSKAIFAHEIMSTPIHTMHEGQTISEAIEFLKRYHIHHIPILNEENLLCGIVSDRDILTNQAQPNLELRFVMSSEVLTAKEKTLIYDIARVMYTEKISCVPIINDSQQLVGMITKTDLLKMFMNSYHLNVAAV